MIGIGFKKNKLYSGRTWSTFKYRGPTISSLADCMKIANRPMTDAVDNLYLYHTDERYIRI